MKTLALPLLALVTLAACDGSAPESDTAASDAAVTAEPAARAPAPTPTASEPAEEEAIPVAMRGRWGLVPADCTSTRGDAKGLLTIDSQTLKFYESLGTLKGIAEASPNHIRGQFAFTGEGMEWQREMSLDLAGNTLTRREYGEEASAEAFSYSKCA